MKNPALLSSLSPSSTERTVVVFDSGLGGAFILPALASVLPKSTPLVYVGDHACMPYGSRSLMELQIRLGLVFSSIRATYGEEALIVLACNTASTASDHAPWLLPCDREQALGPRIDIMSATMPSMAQAYIDRLKHKEASATEAMPVALLATPFTVEQQWFKNLFIKALLALAPQYQHPLTWYDLPCKQLASLIEHAAPIESIEAVLQDYLSLLPQHALQQQGMALLGCTHYLYPHVQHSVQTYLPCWQVWQPHAPLLKAIQVALGVAPKEPGLLMHMLEDRVHWHTTLPYQASKYETIAQHVVQLGLLKTPPMFHPLLL